VNSRDFPPSPDLPPEYEVWGYFKMLKDMSTEGQEFFRLHKMAWDKPLRGAQAQAADNLRRVLEKRLCEQSDVICCTLETAARECLDQLIFPIVIIDEATQAVEPSALIPLTHGAQRFVLVGDQKQLGPVISDRELERSGYGWSLFERLIEAKVEHVMLDRQFRMHPEISAFPNKHFYQGRLHDGVSQKERCGAPMTCFPIQNIPLLFVDCSGDERKLGY
jgi:regulator of nonsense transcripts 1